MARAKALKLSTFSIFGEEKALVAPKPAPIALGKGMVLKESALVAREPTLVHDRQALVCSGLNFKNEQKKRHFRRELGWNAPFQLVYDPFCRVRMKNLHFRPGCLDNHNGEGRA